MSVAEMSKMIARFLAMKTEWGMLVLLRKGTQNQVVWNFIGVGEQSSVSVRLSVRYEGIGAWKVKVWADVNWKKHLGCI